MSSPRCSIGLFAASRSTGVTVLPLIAYFTNEVIGAVAFIRLLLLIAGVEPNPGPTDKLLFRYQYLLIKVGTEVLRNVFNNRVGHDFMRYLNANPAQYKQLRYLTNRILNDTQKNLLPPVDMKPNASNFDITLLALLLRNVCGLCNQGDPVWKTPAPGDLSVEADITRIRGSRNNLQHIGKVYISEADYTDKWDSLCKILKRLGSKYGMTNLSTLIDEAENKEIDEELKKRHDSTLKAWHESERLFDCGIEGLHHGQSKLEDGLSKLEVGQSKLEVGQSKLEDGQTEMKQDLSKLEVGQSKLVDGQSKLADGQSKTEVGLVELKRSIENVERQVENTLKKPKHGILEKSETDIKEILKKSYQDNYHTLGVSPLCGEDDNMELVTIYQRPEMCHVPYHRNRQQEGNYGILSYKEIFGKKDNSFRNIFVTGDAGVGKTSFCQCMAYLWCKSLNGEKVSNEFLQECVDFMARFDFVFYISLWDTVHEDIISMIIDQFFYTTSGEKREEMIQLIENILQQKDCLIILDGLDEYFPHTSRGKTSVLPRKISSDKCTYLTTCRPYKIENVRLSNNDIEHQVQIKGITEQSSKRYIQYIVNHFNHVNHVNKDHQVFLQEVYKCRLESHLCIPIIASQLVLVWFKQTLTNMSRALIYSTVVDMLFERAELKKQIELPPTTATEIQLPESFEDLIYLQKYAPLLQKLCLLSFRSLFKLDKQYSTLVFSRKELMSKPFFFTAEELDFLCKLGLVSKNKIIGCLGELEQKLSFLHKSYLEFLSALFVTSFDTKGLFDYVLKEWNRVEYVHQYENFFLLLAGLSVQKVQFLLERINQTVAEDMSASCLNMITSSCDPCLSRPFRYTDHFVLVYLKKCTTLQWGVSMKSRGLIIQILLLNLLIVLLVTF